MSKCLVTKLKASVDNENLPYYGQVTIKLSDDFSSSVQNFDVMSTEGKSIRYKAYGVSVLKINGNPVGMEGETTGVATISWEGKGKICIYSKYEDISIINLNTAAGFEHPEEVYGDYLPNNIKLVSRSQVNVWDSIEKEIVFSGENVILPLFKDMNYKNFAVSGYNKVFLVGKDEKNFYNIKGDINNIFSIKGFEKSKLVNVSLFEDNVHMSNFDAFKECTNLENIVIHDSKVTATDVVGTLSALLNLKQFTSVNSLFAIDFTPVFNTWKSSGKRSTSCNLYLPNGATANGSSIEGSHVVNFDSAGNWTVS